MRKLIRRKSVNKVSIRTLKSHLDNEFKTGGSELVFSNISTIFQKRWWWGGNYKRTKLFMNEVAKIRHNEMLFQ